MLGGILAAIIVFIFLRNFRSTLIAAVAIPTSIIGAFAVIAALGFTLNQMTMLALTLMVGIVIDDAIVVLENIYRFVEEKGMTPFQAAIEGTREIGLAVMATTLSLLAVFIPVGFIGGIVGRFMSSFGLTVGGGDRDQPDRLVHADADAGGALDQADVERDAGATSTTSDASRRGFYRHIDRIYTRMLQWSMAHRWLIVGDLRPRRRLDRAALPDVGRQLHPGRGRVALPDLGAAAGRLEPGGDAVAGRSHLARRARAAAGRARRAGQSPACGGGGRAATTPARVRPAEADRGARPLAAGADARRRASWWQPYRKCGGDLGAGHRRARRSPAAAARRFSTRSSVPISRSSTSTRRRALEVMGKNPALVDVDRSYQPGLPELRLDIDRKRAADLGVRVAGRLADGQRADRRAGRDDVQRRERSVRSRAEGAGLVPADAGLDRRRDGAHRRRASWCSCATS